MPSSLEGIRLYVLFERSLDYVTACPGKHWEEKQTILCNKERCIIRMKYSGCDNL